MYVDHLTLRDFRSWPELELELGSGITALVGRNGQGKTNIVEAIDYLSRLSSHRVASDAPLVRQGASQAIVRAAAVRDERRAVLEIEINPGRSNRARINSSALPKARELLGVLRSVVFAPDDLALVKVDAPYVQDVNQSVPFWGGPAKLATAGTAAGDSIYSYGNSSLRAGISALSPKRGVSLGDDAGGWTHTVYTVTPGIPGDSGSGFMDAHGNALGVLSTVALAPLAGGSGGSGDPFTFEVVQSSRFSRPNGLRTGSLPGFAASPWAVDRR